MTFAIAGRCERTGRLGVAIATHPIGVGARCPFIAPNVGIVVTMARTDPRLGPLALDLLAHGFTAAEAMQAVVAATPHRHWRQLALIDAEGRTADYSGANVRGEKGEAQDCAAIANIVRSASLPDAMVAAFEKSADLPLARRLLDALEAGEAAGGERQPVVSSALLVVHRESFPYVDLRVDDHARPIAELGRLWSMYAPEADAYVVRAVDPEQAAPPPGMKIG